MYKSYTVCAGEVQRIRGQDVNGDPPNLKLRCLGSRTLQTWTIMNQERFASSRIILSRTEVEKGLMLQDSHQTVTLNYNCPPPRGAGFEICVDHWIRQAYGGELHYLKGQATNFSPVGKGWNSVPSACDNRSLREEVPTEIPLWGVESWWTIQFWFWFWSVDTNWKIDTGPSTTPLDIGWVLPSVDDLNHGFKYSNQGGSWRRKRYICTACVWSRPGGTLCKQQCRWKQKHNVTYAW